MEIARTKNTIKGTFFGFLNKIIGLVFPFIIRTCIIYWLGTNYVGLNSLFTSILSVLSLAELGFGSAMVYSLYQPLANDDKEKICALMNFYKFIYRIIGIIVLFIGIALIPLLPYLVKSDLPSDVNLYVLYGIYLGNSAISYWLFAYKNCLLTATQRIDVSSNISSLINLIIYSLQIVLLFIFKNYYLYVICLPISSISINLVTAIFVDKMYPEFRAKGKLDKKTIKDISKQVCGLMIQRLAYTSRNAFDSMIISAYLGLVVVGIYNNYFYVINALTSILAILFTAMRGGLGNSVVKESIEKNYNDFRKINFLYMQVSGWCTICLVILFQPFMKMWVGIEFMFPFYLVILFSVYFYAMAMTDPIGAYITATGIWWNCRLSYCIEAILNLALNLILGYFWGVTGIVVAKIITVVFVNYILNCYILFKYYFKGVDKKRYVLENLVYIFISLLVGFVCFFSTKFLPEFDNKWAELGIIILKGVICTFITFAVYFLVYHKFSLFAESKKWLFYRLKKKDKEVNQ